MGSLIRSEEMVLLRLYFERAAAHATVDELGRLGLVEFRDLNAGTSAFQRGFAANVRMCEDMQRRIRYLQRCLTESPDGGEHSPMELDMTVDDEMYEMKGEGLRLEDLDDRLEELEGRLTDLDTNWELLRTQLNELVELSYVLDKGALFMKTGPRAQEAEYGTLGIPQSVGGSDDGMFGVKERNGMTAGRKMEEGLMGRSGGSGSGRGGPASMQTQSTLLSFYAGVISKESVPIFERVLFRATRGNCHTRFADIQEPLHDPHSGESVLKTVFMVFFSGSLVKTKVAKICTAFNARRYDFPENPTDHSHAVEDVEARISDLRAVIETTAHQRQDILKDVSSQLPIWDEKVRREKAIFHTLNLLNFDMSNSLFIAEIWCPSHGTDAVRLALDTGRKRSRAQVPSIVENQSFGKETPPTYFKINKVTEVFHGIVESYGVAQYEEVNPAPFAIITFPFLFAVMFGDVGHGIFMALFAAYVIMNERRMVRHKLNEFMQTCYDGRYMLFLMGLFSVFTGLIYNECFAVPLNLFRSRWQFTKESAMACGVDNCDVPSAVKPPLSPYPFGFDPIWKGSSNGLVFFNSYKMKLSIVLGVSQMVLGIYLSYKNAKFFREPLDIWHVYIPQMIFMNATFGYLVLLIILKWSINWDSPSCRSDPNCVPPDLKSVLIGMFMSPGNLPEEGQLYTGQKYVQIVLLLLALISVPWMLLPKPLLLKKRHERVEQYSSTADDSERQELLRNEKSGGGYVNGGKNPDDASAAAASSSSSSTSSSSNAKQKQDDKEALKEADGPNGVAAFGGGAVGAGAVGEEGEGGHGKFDFAETMVNQMIHTIEFVLGAVSNTASYLRLWALSLAHAELSDVFLEKLLITTTEIGSPIFIIIGFFMWVVLTLGVLMFMEALSAFLHTLRLHWVEFQNKFYNLHGNGSKFAPFDYKILREEALMD